MRDEKAWRGESLSQFGENSEACSLNTADRIKILRGHGVRAGHVCRNVTLQVLFVKAQSRIVAPFRSCGKCIMQRRRETARQK